MFKWGEREKQQHFFKPTLCIRDKQKLAQGQFKKKIKNICKIILNTPNVPDGKVPSCTEDASPHTKYCTFLERAAERKDIIEAIDKPAHTTAGPFPSIPWGHATTGTRPRQVSGSAGGWQGPASPSKQTGALKKHIPGTW